MASLTRDIRDTLVPDPAAHGSGKSDPPWVRARA